MLLLGLFLLPGFTTLLHSTSTPVAETGGAEQYQGACRYNAQGWVYVSIHGNATERGYQYGYLLAPEIVDILQRWANVIHNHPHLDRISTHLSESRYQRMSETWWRFCTREITRLYWEKYPVEYQQEIAAIAAGVSGHGGQLFGRPVTTQDILTLNEMYEYLSKMEIVKKKIHPFRTLFHQLRDVVPEMASLSDSVLLDAFLNEEPAHHCNGFIATGNATSHGQIVIGHGTICGGAMWWWNYSISLRWNIIVDVSPSEGHRFLMPTSPGYIWSDEDYYQSESGIVLLETTVPQGTYDDVGLPLSIRVRTAIQYGNSIDDVIHSLCHRNDGCMNAVWLVGDTKTGEIARLDLGYQHAAIWRTFNGYYWSANNPMNLEVRAEKFQMKKLVKNFVLTFFGYHSLGYATLRYRPVDRDIAFDTLGKAHYGHIDCGIVKSIMLTLPISEWITDSKASDSDLIRNNGLWAYYGNPQHALVMTGFDHPQPSSEVVPATGWLLLYARPHATTTTYTPTVVTPQNTTNVIWSTVLSNETNRTRGASADGILYWTLSKGAVIAMNASTGVVLWQHNVGLNPTTPLLTSDAVYVGHEGGLSCFSKAGMLLWMSPTPGLVTSTPVQQGTLVVVGDDTGNITAVDAQTGVPQGRARLPASALVGPGTGTLVYACAGSSCYSLNFSAHQPVWMFTTGGPITVPPVESQGTVYVASWDSQLYALNATSGSLLWSFTSGWGFNAPLIVDGDRIYVGGMDNSLYVLTKEGTVVWNATVTASIQSAPRVSGTVVLVAADDGHLYAFDRDSGASAWWFTPSYAIQGVKNFITTPLHTDILVEDECVCIGVNGTVYAVEMPTTVLRR